MSLPAVIPARVPAKVAPSKRYIPQTDHSNLKTYFSVQYLVPADSSSASRAISIFVSAMLLNTISGGLVVFSNIPCDFA